jgi:hypothetical protein
MNDVAQDPYARAVWQALSRERLGGIFADAPKQFRNRKALSPLLNRVRHLRNRAFHHEPIWHWRDLREQHAIALDLIGWMSPPLRETVGALDRFDSVYAAGLGPFREIVLTEAGRHEPLDRAVLLAGRFVGR